jgi:hypothetical protein
VAWAVWEGALLVQDAVEGDSPFNVLSFIPVKIASVWEAVFDCIATAFGLS